MRERWFVDGWRSNAGESDTACRVRRPPVTPLIWKAGLGLAEAFLRCLAGGAEHCADLRPGDSMRAGCCDCLAKVLVGTVEVEAGIFDFHQVGVICVLRPVVGFSGFAHVSSLP